MTTIIQPCENGEMLSGWELHCKCLGTFIMAQGPFVTQDHQVYLTIIVTGNTWSISSETESIGLICEQPDTQTYHPMEKNVPLQLSIDWCPRGRKIHLVQTMADDPTDKPEETDEAKETVQVSKRQWQDPPNRETICAAFGTYHKIREPDTLWYETIGFSLPSWSFEDYLLAMAMASVENWTLAQVVDRRVLNQPLNQPIIRLDDLKHFWGPEEWDKDQQLISGLVESKLKFPPIVYLRLPNGRYFCLDGAHRSVACALTKSDSIAVCVVSCPTEDSKSIDLENILDV